MATILSYCALKYAAGYSDLAEKEGFWMDIGIRSHDASGKALTPVAIAATTPHLLPIREIRVRWQEALSISGELDAGLDPEANLRKQNMRELQQRQRKNFSMFEAAPSPDSTQNGMSGSKTEENYKPSDEHGRK